MQYKFFLIHVIIMLSVVLSVATLVSCSFDYTSANIEQKLDENVPDILIENVKLVFVRGTTVTIEADRAELYSTQKQQLMYNVHFQEHSNSDEVRITGRVEQIAIDTDTNDIIMVGKLWARSNKDEAEITTDYLKWNDKDQIIEGSIISSVEIKKDIGSYISGYGFKGDAEKRELTIAKSTVGKLVVDE